MEYYRQSSADTLHALDSTPDGLTQAQADERLARDGHNVLAEPPKPSVVKRFFAQLADPMILVLLAAALVSAVTSAYAHESFADVIIILLVVIINAVLGVYQESKAEQAIAALKAAGVTKTVMLTGDIQKVADYVARDLGVDEVRAELLPADKVARVEELLKAEPEGAKLAFVGDGINDAPVLSRADIGIAMGAMGSDAAIEAADVVLMDDDPMKIAKAIKISRKCIRIVHENIVFSLGVKLLCLLLVALGFANMWMGIFADVGVMVLAVLNAIRALRVHDL